MVTKDEFKILIKALKAVYTDPRFVPDKDAFDVWYELLKNFDYEILSKAVYAYLQTSSKIPAISDIRTKALELQGEATMSGSEAWALVSKALSNSGYHSVEEFNKLPYPVQKAVGSASNLQAWAAVNMGEVETVIQSHFLKSYTLESARFDTMRSYPEQLERLIESNKAEPPRIEERIGMVGLTPERIDTIVERIIKKVEEERNE